MSRPANRDANQRSTRSRVALTTARLTTLIVLATVSSLWAQTGVLGARFSRFVETLEAADSATRPRLIDSLISSSATFPLIEDDTVATFLFRGSADTVAIAGDPTKWRPDEFLMRRLLETDLWYYQTVFESDARLDYKLVIDGNRWILDPLNPHTVVGPVSENSELRMPRYEAPQEIVPRTDIETGSLQKFDVRSDVLGNTREVAVYLPPHYESGSDSHGVALFHDGSDWLGFGPAPTILDNLIADGTIAPIIAVFVSPIDRMAEYGYTTPGEAYARFVITELMPEVDRRFRTRRDPSGRATVGVSLSGLIATQIAYRNPETFGLVAAISPAYWIRDDAIVKEIAEGPVRPIRIYLDAGSYELLVSPSAMVMEHVLASKGYSLRSNLWPEGHSWGSWRAHLDDALQFLFPPD